MLNKERIKLEVQNKIPKYRGRPVLREEECYAVFCKLLENLELDATQLSSEEMEQNIKEIREELIEELKGKNV